MPGVQFANVNWEKEEAKAIQGHHRRLEKRERHQETRKKQRQEIKDGNAFLRFLFDCHDDRGLRSLLEESVHAFAFLMIIYDSSYTDSKLMDTFLKRDLRAEELTRSELVMLLDWRQAFITEGIFHDHRIELESREDVDGESQRK